jgi:hypothetical protein
MKSGWIESGLRKSGLIKSRRMKSRSTDLKKYAPFLIGFGSVAVVATAWWLISRNRKRAEEKPPKRAPQLNIENPGSQDEFISATSESGLG